MTPGTILNALFLEPWLQLLELIYMLGSRALSVPGVVIILSGLAAGLLFLLFYIDPKTHAKNRRRLLLSLLPQAALAAVSCRFFSGLEIIKGVAFGPVADLAEADGLLSWFGADVNLLPLLLILTGAAAAFLYTGGLPLKIRIPFFVIAAALPVFWYRAPAALILFWLAFEGMALLVFSFRYLKHPRRVLLFLLAFCGLILLALGARLCLPALRVKGLAVFAAGLLLCLPLAVFFLFKKKQKPLNMPSPKGSVTDFVMEGLFFAFLFGLVIPSTVIAASPQEFVDLYDYVHPLRYVAECFLLSLGTFELWAGLAYAFRKDSVRRLAEWLLWPLGMLLALNDFFFGKDLGTMNNRLVFDRGVSFGTKSSLVNLLVLALVFALLVFISFKWESARRLVLFSALMTFLTLSVMNVIGICQSLASVNPSEQKAESISFTLSKTEKNVVVIMLDRAMGAYVPYIMNEKPELMEQFDGFTYYSNTVSFGAHTNVAAPAVFGGYEYTPAAMNSRADESLADKHDEALLMLPVLFDAAGFDVSVYDAPYAGYSEIPDLSVFSDYPDISAYISSGYFREESEAESDAAGKPRLLFRFGMMKTMPLLLQTVLYDGGNYLLSANSSAQKILSPTAAVGLDSGYMDAYRVLDNLSALTLVEEKTNGSFISLSNNLTHEMMMLQLPDYVPAENVDNTDGSASTDTLLNLNGHSLKMDITQRHIAYQVNMSAFLLLGQWFDTLRELDVYDNTRIILVSDHGFCWGQLEELILDETADASDFDLRYGDAQTYFPLLMVKDYGSSGFVTDDGFMTNADTPTLAVRDLIDNPTNPFTGKTIDNSEKSAHGQLILATDKVNITENNGNTFLPGRWYSVRDSIWQKSNWTLSEEYGVLTEANAK